MPTELTVILINGCIGIITIGVSYLINRRSVLANTHKTEHEAGATEASEYNTYSEIAERYARQVKDLQEQLDAVRTQSRSDIANLTQRVNILTVQLQDRDRDLVKLKDWANRLVYQVKSLGHEPIPFEPVPMPEKGGS